MDQKRYQPIWETSFDKRPVPALLRPFHLALRIRGLVDAVVVAVRDPDVFLLQVALWRDGGLKGLYQFRRLRELSRLLADPDTTVLELGSGASTLLIAKRARAAVSIEESALWANKLIETLNAAWWIRPSCRALATRQISVRERREWLDDRGQWVCGYTLSADVVDRHWDVVYLDGPTNWPQKEPSRSTGAVALPNADVLTLASLPKEIWVDGRIDTLRYLAQNLPQRWRVVTQMHLPRSSRSLFHTLFFSPETHSPTSP